MSDLDERELVRRNLDHQARAREFRMMELPGYMEWSNRKSAEGVSDAYIAHLDATSTWLLPEEAAAMSDNDYDELLDDLIDGLEPDVDVDSD